MTKQFYLSASAACRFHYWSLFFLLTVFTFISGGCDNDECETTKDCNDDMMCVQGKCIAPSDHIQTGDSPQTGSTISGTVQQDSADDTDDSDTASVPLQKDTSSSENPIPDTAYGSLFDPSDRDINSQQPPGCVIYHDGYYSCALTGYVTVGMCDLVNWEGCSSALFPESCKLLVVDDVSITLKTICYSPLSGNVADPPEYACADAGGEWLPCPY
ncbi:MAG: hypothetical protein JXX14_15460 [Deltaproteobacteria bacterium]|nr:hypothetical protein [Deltaproteobacteria bacterium]